MRRWRFGNYVRLLPLPLLVGAVLMVSGVTSNVFATTSTSNSYSVSETQFGGGSSNQTCSGQYCAKVSIGNTSNSTSTVSGGTASFGTLTGDDPRLEMIVSPGTTNLGVLKPDQTATQTSTIQIRNYLNGGGYALQVIGNPPTNGSHALSTSTSVTGSVAGTEQFGMNVVANTSPSVGADPVQQPSGAGTFGQAVSGYSTANKFKYASGDTVAQGVAKTGRTDYTLTIVVNISDATPAGHYTGTYQVVAIPVY